MPESAESPTPASEWKTHLFQRHPDPYSVQGQTRGLTIKALYQRSLMDCIAPARTYTPGTGRPVAVSTP